MVWRPKIYALIETGNKQYKVTEGQTLVVDRLPDKEGSRIQLDKVLLLANDDKVTIGKPYVEGARVMAVVKENGKGDKIIVFKYKSKVRYRRKNGHRQLYTSLNIDRILPPGTQDVKVEKPTAKKAEPKKTVEAMKPAVTEELKKTEVIKPAAKAPAKKKTTTAKSVAKKAPAKKKEEKPDGA